MRSAVGERDTRAGHQILDCRRHEHLARSGEPRHAWADVDGDPTDVGAATFDLTGMKSRSHFDAQRPHCLADRLRASHGTRGPVEGREHAVTRRVDSATTMALDLAGDQRVVTV